MSSSAVDLLIGKIVSALENEVLLIGGVRDEIVQLRQELESMRSFLQDADQKKGQTKGERNWVSSVRDITFQVEDIIDEFVHHMNKQKSIGGKFMRSLCQIFYFPKNMWVRRRIATSLCKLNNMIKAIPERNQRYGVNHIGRSSSHLDNRHGLQGPNRGESSLFFKDDDLVGIEDGKQQLLGWLIGKERQRAVISVVGMGGSGKTTLVAKAYDSKIVKQHFDCYAWITVSKSYQVDDLLRSMIKEFHKARKEAVPMDLSAMSHRELVQTTGNYLQSKRYVIVFDDVWSTNLWKDIYVTLPDEGLGSRVMLTTRMEDIAASSYFGVKSYVHYVEPLGVRDAWELFCLKAFSGNQNRCCPPELKTVAQDLVAKCGGLPLPIVALGGVMSSKDLESDWRKVYNNLSWELNNNPRLEVVKTVLLLSFNDLPYRIKSCFLYCCLFPKSYPIKRNRLIRIWMAEGFVEKVRGITPEEVAESYLRQLVSRSMLLVVERNEEGRVKVCKMHDLIRELALSISETENFCAIYDDRESSGSEDGGILRRLSVHTIGGDVIQSHKGMSHLRSLLVFAVNDMISPSLKSLLCDLRLLKVLDLQDIPVVNLPDELVDLFNLRYLNLCRTKVSELPKSIERLCNLETLNIVRSKVQVLPDGITKLQNLRNLIMGRINIGNSTDFEYVFGVRGPDDIWKLRNLQVLHCIEAGGPKMMKQLKSMTQLKKFGIIKIRAADEEELCLSVQNMSLLRSLYVMAADEEECLQMDALFSAPTLPHLKKLYFYGKLEKLPHWFPSLESVTRLVLHWSRLTEDPLPHIQALPRLGYLALSNACQGRTLLCFGAGFHKLKELWLINLPDLNEIVIERGVMPGLNRLEIRWCMQLKTLPGGLMHLTDLHELDLVNASDELIHSIRAQGSSSKDGPMLPQHITRINHWRVSSDGVRQYENLLSTSTG